MRGRGADTSDIMNLARASARPEEGRFVPLDARSRDSVLDRAVVARLMVGKYKNHVRGVPLVKDVLSLHLYEVILSEIRPRTVVDLGTALGGSALWFSERVPQDTRIVTIDIDDIRMDACDAPNITFAQLDVTDEQAVRDTLRAMPHPWLVSEDCHVDASALMDVLAPLLEVGDYIVFEDTHPLNPDKPGMSAESSEYSTASEWALIKLRSVEDAMRARPEFQVDADVQDFYGYNACTHINSVYCKRR